MKYCYGIDIGGTTVKMGFFSTSGELLQKWEIPTRVENGGESILLDICESANRQLKDLSITPEDVLFMGVGVPAAVRGNGIVDSTTNLGWGYKEVKRELEEMSGFKVYVENDANVAALGEMWKGSGSGYHNMVMITLGTGVGGGVIVNGHLVTGKNGGAWRYLRELQ